MDESIKREMNEFFHKENWSIIRSSTGGNVLYKYHNEFCDMQIEHIENEGAILYTFEEEEIKALVKIEYQGKLLRLVELLCAFGSKMSSTYYVQQLRDIYSEYPKLFIYNKNGFYLLRPTDDEPISNFL